MKNTLPTLSVILSAVLITLFCPAYTVQESEANQPRATEVKEDKKAEVVKQLGNLPAFFIENRGQTAEEARYYFKGSDTVYFTDSAVVFQKIESRRGPKPESNTDNADSNDNKNNVGARHAVPLRDVGAAGLQPCDTPSGETASEPLQGVAYRLEFLGANATTPRARKELQGKVNYFIGNDPSRWHNNIPTYREIVYPGLYGGVKNVDAGCISTHQQPIRRGDSCGRPNRAGARPAPTLAQNDIPGGMIDLVYKGVKGGMKYEFIVHPGADPGVIKMSYRGIDGLSIDESGNLIIHTALGNVKDERPYCY
ncbi:MAG: hypothetical protein V3V45_04950, partial [Candidatus Brocadiales bacterium]